MDDRASETKTDGHLCLVVGASGALGSRVTRRLLAEGGRVRAASRDPARLAPLEKLGAEPVRLDLLEPDGLATALDGSLHVVIASHGLVPPSRRNTPAAVDGEGARRLIDAAAAAGVRRVVFVSAAAADREATVFARVKRATERHLERAGVPWTVLRPSIFVENHALVLLGEPLRAGKPVPFFGAGSEPLNWISADDVAADVVRPARPRGGGRRAGAARRRPGRRGGADAGGRRGGGVGACARRGRRRLTPPQSAWEARSDGASAIRPPYDRHRGRRQVKARPPAQGCCARSGCRPRVDRTCCPARPTRSRPGRAPASGRGRR